MSRYIDADELMKTISSTKFTSLGANDILVTCCQIVIDNAPTADVRENVKACWQIGESNKQRRHAGMFCSNCGFEVCSADKGWNVYVDDHYHYCPNCGADMRGEA